MTPFPTSHGDKKRLSRIRQEVSVLFRGFLRQKFENSTCNSTKRTARSGSADNLSFSRFEIFRADDKVSQISVDDSEPDADESAESGEGEAGREDKTESADENENLPPQRATSEPTLVSPFIRKNERLEHSSLDLSQAIEELEEEDTVSMHSAATEVDSAHRIKDPVDSEYELAGPIITKMVQKYRRDSETDLPKEETDVARGTLLSHSATKIDPQPLSFFYGSQVGTMHQGSDYFSERSRDKQGLANCISAYVYSFIKPPNRWSSQDIDKVLEVGDRLYLESLERFHLHTDKVLKPKELHDVVTFEDKRIRYKIHDPDITGVTKSQDPKIFDLLKGLVLFFDRFRSGILQTANTNILIWKRKHFYVFDPTSRDLNLYRDPTGTAVVANFYDLQSALVMLVDRGKLDNAPYIISRIAVKKILADNEDKDDGDSTDMRKESEYKIVTCTKAVVQGTLHVGDKCFEICQSRQSLCVVILGLIYYHITPAAAWHAKTVNKFLLVGNQLYQECIKEMTTEDFKLENVPAFFTIGPLTIELVIYGNQSAGFMFRKSQCFFEEMLKKFFTKHSTALVEIDKYCVGIWKQRTYFYLFDPYARGKDGLKSPDGAACVSMNGSLKTVVETITHNFEQKEYIFRIHALKLLKLNRDPEYGPKPVRYVDSEVDVTNAIKVGTKRAVQEVKPISVDLTEQAMKTMPTADMDIGPSVIEVASGVESINQKFVKDLPVQCTKPILLIQPPPPEMICDLDSPSLSDTQIIQSRPDPEEKDEGLARKYLEDIEKRERVLEKLLEMPAEGEIEEEEEDDMETLFKGEAGEEMEGEDERDVGIQKGRDPNLKMESIEVNTDLLGVNPLPRILLEPTDMSRTLKAKRRAMAIAIMRLRRREDENDEEDQVEELKRKSNYVTLPDCSQVLYGSTNVAVVESDRYEDAHPYVSLMALVMMRKYSLHTWSTQIVDFIVTTGVEIYKAVEIDYGSFHMLEIPQVAIGKDTYNIVVEHIFDSLLEPVILGSALEKILKKFCMAVVACKIYSCAVFVRRGVYYMFDCFGNNKVGLGEGPDNTGIACMFRFRKVPEIVTRFLYNKAQREVIEPTEATRFVISVAKVSNVFLDAVEMQKRQEKILEMEYEERAGNGEGEEAKKPPKPRNYLGYQKRGRFVTIQGTSGLEGRMDMDGQVKVCHFICVCAMLGLVCKPLKKWTTKRVDYIFDSGTSLFPYIDNTNFADKRSIKNLLIDRYFFDVVIKRLVVEKPDRFKHIFAALKFIQARKYKYLLLQYANCCFVLYVTKKYFHVFDPYGLYNGKEAEEEQEDEPDRDESKKEARGKACWIKFESLNKLKNYLCTNIPEDDDCFFFFTVNISNLRKATRWRRLEYKLKSERSKRKKKPKELRERPVKILHENEEWLEVYPIPWSRMTKNLACGVKREAKSHKWNNWDVEYPNDLFSLVGTLHQTSKGFSRKSRGKQTIANCIVAVIMTEMYSFQTWNSSILSTILRTGDAYFKDSTEGIDDENYELRIEDFKTELVVNPYNVKVRYEPFVEGTMFVIRAKQYNLSRALKHFFEKRENRNGIIACIREGSKTKFLSFGRVQFGEYYMYDCQTLGPPMFLDKYRSASYILRCLSLNRLIHIMTLTLRCGDFYIYEVQVVPPGPPEKEEELKVTDYETVTETEEGMTVAEEGG